VSQLIADDVSNDVSNDTKAHLHEKTASYASPVN
jgi:hypothetical protein